MAMWEVILICLVFHQGVLGLIAGNFRHFSSSSKRVGQIQVSGGTTPYTYSLESQDGSKAIADFLFMFENDVIKTKANSVFDSSTKNSYVLTITDIDQDILTLWNLCPPSSCIRIVSDSAVTAETATGTLTVSVSASSNSPPVFNPVSYCRSVQENAPTGTTVGTYTATDEDTVDVLTYSIEGNDGKFSISNTGELTTIGSFDKTKTANYILLIKATDNTATATATVTVLLDEACPGSKKNGGEKASKPFVVLFSCLMPFWLICLNDSFDRQFLQ